MSKFQFKEFLIEQTGAEMKVSTDACILGAWVKPSKNVKNILDIGSGTGLLSLMLAQKTTAIIDAIEIDELHYKLCLHNCETSKYSSQIVVHHTSILEYKINKETKYDLVISNPPFFENQYKSPISRKNISRHTLNLTYLDLISCIDALLNEEGYFYCLLPIESIEKFIKIAKTNYIYCIEKVLITKNLVEDCKRVILGFSKKEIEKKESIIKIYENYPSLEFSSLYVNLMREFYLDKN